MSQSWKDRLSGRMPEEREREIDIFEHEIALRKQGKIDEKVFAETRLRRGAYGQRYDNGQRHDGTTTQTLQYPSGDLTKGPMTMWDAPGMQRIKVPFGKLTAEQMEAFAACAEEYSDGICHVTTRQAIQLHFVHIEDTPDLMRRMMAVGITSREACGNSVRAITGCPFAGVCKDQSFDTSPYANALTWFLMGHPDAQDFGRKFKISFSGCADHACALANIHDIGAVASVQNGQRGFQLFVGGGLGAVPHEAQLLEPFTHESELLPVAQAICRVFARLGEKKNRAKARLKFVVAKLGIEEFARLVAEERKILPHDPRWTAYLEDLRITDDKPLKPGKALDASADLPVGFKLWRGTNLRPQAQPGYVVATINLPLGDATSAQFRALAELSRRYTGEGTVRTTIEQNLAFRWLPEADAPAFWKELDAIGLGRDGAGTVRDLTTCPGTDTCKLGISSSRGLTAELARHLQAKPEIDAGVQQLRIKTSGCFNSCGQHHVADVGFLGVSRNVNGRRVPHFQLVVGGQWTNNGGAYGLAIGAFPSKKIPALVDTLTGYWVSAREPGERFQAFIQRVGKAKIRQHLLDAGLAEVPAYAADPSYYSDWGDVREYTIGDMGVGECAGEIVTQSEFGLAASEREVFEAQLHLDAGNSDGAVSMSFSAMLQAAKALLKAERPGDAPADADGIVSGFRERIYDTGLFQDAAATRFAQFLFRMHEDPPEKPSRDRARQAIEEAQMFIESAHTCLGRLQERKAS